MEENTRINIFKLQKAVISVLIILFVTGCVNGCSNGNAIEDSTTNEVNEHSVTNTEESVTDKIESDESMVQTAEITQDLITNGYEGEWYRTNVKSYQWARITISNWKEGESFDVTVLANYGDYGGSLEGTATFIEEDMAVLYDEHVEDFLKEHEGDHGIYFQFSENAILVTHDSDVRMWFGGGGTATAEGTYVQGEPEYINCADVGEIFTEEELEAIQELLGDRYEPLFKNVIEIGEITEYGIDNGRLWEAYRPPYGVEWCNILIYDDGRIYIEGYAYGDYPKEFYTNSDDTEMPDVELLKKEYLTKEGENP